MNKYLKNLANGIFETEVPKILSSTESIYTDIVADSTVSGYFNINADGKISGVCEVRGEGLTLTDNPFSGTECEIGYSACAKGKLPGDKISGEIEVYTNAGKLTIPYCFSVVKKVFNTPFGDINNNRTFADLAKKDEKVAEEFFVSDEFKSICIDNNEKLESCYEILRRQADIKSAINTYLIIAGEKRSEGKIGSLASEFARENGFAWGGRTPESGEEYIDNTVNMDMDKLTQKWFAVRKTIVKNYIDFRIKKIDADTFLKQSLEEISSAEPVFMTETGYKKHRAYIELQIAKSLLLAISGDFASSQSITDEYTDELESDEMFGKDAYFTYLYIRVMHENGNSEFKNKVRKKLSDISNNANIKTSWLAVYYQYHLDNNRDDNISMWLAEFKEEYSKGYREQILLLESLKILNRDPMLLRMLNSFEIDVLRFGTERKIIEDRLINRVKEVAEEDSRSNENIIEFLMSEYDQYKDESILSSLVGKLIKNGMLDEKYTPYYEDAVNKDIKVTLLYEYYLMSHNFNKPATFPEEVLRYFLFENSIDYRAKAFLYNNIIRMKDDIPDIYSEYEELIKQFTFDQLSEMHIDSNLASLYEWLWSDALTRDDRTALAVFKLQFMWKFTIDTDEITHVIIKNKEMLNWKKVPFRDREAYACVVTEGSTFEEEAVFFFMDGEGRLRAPQEVMYSRMKALDVSVLSHRAESCMTESLFLYYRYKQEKTANNIDGASFFAKNLIIRGKITESFKDILTSEVTKWQNTGYSVTDTKVSDTKSLKSQIQSARNKEDILAKMIYTKQPPSITEKLFADLRSSGSTGVVMDAYVAYQAYICIKQNEECDRNIIPIIGNKLREGNKVIDVEKLAYLKLVASKEAEPMGEDDVEICQNLLNNFVGKRYLFSFFSKLQKKIEIPIHIIDKTIIEYSGVIGSNVRLYDKTDEEAESYVDTQMDEMLLGLYSVPVVIFAKDKYKYEIVEETADGREFREEGITTFKASDRVIPNSSFDMINKMDKELKKKEKSELLKSMSEYNCKLMINDSVFKCSN